MHALDHLGSYERAFCDNAFQRDRMVEVVGAERTWIAREFPKTADECAIIHNVFCDLSGRTIWQYEDDVLQCLVKAGYEIEGRVQNTIFPGQIRSANVFGGGTHPSASSRSCARISSKETYATLVSHTYRQPRYILSVFGDRD